MVNQAQQKIRHSKLRNTGILYELLVRQMTTDTLKNKDSVATSILREYFINNEVSREFKIYHTLSTAKNLSEAKSTMLLTSCLEAYKKLNKTNLRKQKYALIAEIKKNYNIDEFFKTKVDNYKVLASIYMLFESAQAEIMDEKHDAAYKYTILESITTKPEDSKNELLEEFSSYDSGTRSLIYRMLIEKFNEKYKNFNDRQRNLLKEYINNISTSDNLKQYVNKEMIAVKEELGSLVDKTEDAARKLKIQEIQSFINPVEKTVTDKDLNNLLYSYELIHEYEKKS